MLGILPAVLVPTCSATYQAAPDTSLQVDTPFYDEVPGLQVAVPGSASIYSFEALAPCSTP